MSEDNQQHLLDVRQEKYLNWLLTPAHERQPASQALYCKENNVDPTTVRRWQNKPNFRKEWERRVDQLQGSPERTQRLLDSLYNKALDGDVRAANLYLQATHRLVPVSKQTVSGSKPLKELTDTELDGLIEQMAKREKDSRSANNLRAV
jgi:hypothetical protein